MMLFYALLTHTKDIKPLQNLPLIVSALATAVLLIAFFIGVWKGVRRVSWGGLIWVAASAGFFLLEFVLGTEYSLKPHIATFIADESLATCLSSLLLALACIVAALLFHGICSLLFRPRIQFVDKDGNRFQIDENSVECDNEEKDCGDEESDEAETSLCKGGCKPSLLGRIFGGLICSINVAAIFVAVLAIALLIICATPLKDGWLAPVFTHAYMPLVQKYAFQYAFDFLMIGLILKMARHGFEKGFIESLRTLLVSVGRLVGIGVAFYLPFSPYALPVEQGGVGILYSYVFRCIDVATRMGLSETLAPIVGKILAGVLLFLLVLLVAALLGLILKALAKGIEGVSFLRVLDGTLACVVYMIIGVAICGLVCSAFYVFDAYGIVNVSRVFEEHSLVKKLFDACGFYIQPALDNFNAMIGGLISIP